MIDLDEDERQHLSANIAWLAAADPDDWHRVALDFNWSEPLYVLDWIVRQPRCDVATALTIFWQGEPECWMAEADGEGGDEEPDGYSWLNAKICEYVAQRVAAGGYHRSEIAYYPDTWNQKAYMQLVECEKRLANPNFRTTPDLILNRPGRQVVNDWDFAQRYPEAFHLSSGYCEPQPLEGDYQLYERPGFAEDWNKLKSIEDATFERLPDWLKEQPTAQPSQRLETLDELRVISSNPIGDDGAAARIRALRRNTGAVAVVRSPADSRPGQDADDATSWQPDNFVSDARLLMPLVAACNVGAMGMIAGALRYFSSVDREMSGWMILICVIGMVICLRGLMTELRDWKGAFGGAPDENEMRAFTWSVFPAFFIGGAVGWWGFASLLGDGGMAERITLGVVALAAIGICGAVAMLIARKLVTR